MTQASVHQVNLVYEWIDRFRKSGNSTANLPTPEEIAIEMIQLGGFTQDGKEWLLSESVIYDWLHEWERRETVTVVDVKKLSFWQKLFGKGSGQ